MTDASKPPTPKRKRNCTSKPVRTRLQRFTLTAEGQLRLEAAEGTADATAYCLAVEPGEGQPTGGPSHLRRGLLLTPCGDADPSLTRWIFPGARPQPQHSDSERESGLFALF